MKLKNKENRMAKKSGPIAASFFAGIGGFDLGLENSGIPVIFQCEVDKFCRKVLTKGWPGIRQLEDINQVQPHEIPTSDIWCGGFPCQDVSVARGLLGRHGLKGKRSGLFFRFADLISHKKPEVILIENVHGLFNSNSGRDFKTILLSLNKMGYAVSWRLLNSKFFGVPQSRARVYICAWKNNLFSAAKVLFEDEPVRVSHELKNGFLDKSKNSKGSSIAPKTAFCLAATSGRHTGTDWSRTYIAYPDSARRLTPLECERLQGFPDEWTLVSDQEISDKERSDSLRYHALGNAVSVPVVEWIANRIKARFRQSQVSQGRKINLLRFMQQEYSYLINQKQRIGRLTDNSAQNERILWGNCGIAWKSEYFTSSIDPAISQMRLKELGEIVEEKKPDRRYFLSPNAAEGILRRVDSQSRRIFPPLRKALEEMTRS